MAKWAEKSVVFINGLKGREKSEGRLKANSGEWCLNHVSVWQHTRSILSAINLFYQLKREKYTKVPPMQTGFEVMA